MMLVGMESAVRVWCLEKWWPRVNGCRGILRLIVEFARETEVRFERLNLANVPGGGGTTLLKQTVFHPRLPYMAVVVVSAGGGQSIHTVSVFTTGFLPQHWNRTPFLLQRPGISTPVFHPLDPVMAFIDTSCVHVHHLRDTARQQTLRPMVADHLRVCPAVLRFHPFRPRMVAAGLLWDPDAPLSHPPGQSWVAVWESLPGGGWAHERTLLFRDLTVTDVEFWERDSIVLVARTATLSRVLLAPPQREPTQQIDEASLAHLMSFDSVRDLVCADGRHLVVYTANQCLFVLEAGKPVRDIRLPLLSAVWRFGREVYLSRGCNTVDRLDPKTLRREPLNAASEQYSFRVVQCHPVLRVWSPHRPPFLRIEHMRVP